MEQVKGVYMSDSNRILERPCRDSRTGNKLAAINMEADRPRSSYSPKDSSKRCDSCCCDLVNINFFSGTFTTATPSRESFTIPAEGEH